jgi:endonuclease/exonuclease/phosphatase family metal-dependent hydrolase
MPVTLCTFNANNLFVRYRFGDTFPGDQSHKSAVTDPAEGYLPMYNQAAFKLFNPTQRDLAGQAISQGGDAYPDIVCLQEIESLIALRSFNTQHLADTYEHALLIDSRDPRQIDVGVLSQLPIVGVRSHVDDRKPGAAPDAEGAWLFSRDCLEVEVALDADRSLVLLINHLKSKFIDHRAADTPEKVAQAQADNDARRRAQAEGVLRILRERFPGQEFERALFAVVGDLNDQATSAPLAPLLDGSGLVNALERIAEESERWTEWYRSANSVSQLDHLLLSPALAAATDGQVPHIERRGIGFARRLQGGGIGPRQTHYERSDDDPNPIDVDFQFERFPAVTPDEYASDHCPVILTVP